VAEEHGENIGDRVGSNIYITLSTKVRQWETGQADTLVRPIRGLVQAIRARDRIEFAGYEGGALSFDWGLRRIVVHRQRIVRILEESLRSKRQTQKREQ